MKIATYNLMHSLHEDLLLENIKLIINKGTQVLCLQEYEPPFTDTFQQFLKSLPTHWEIYEIHTSMGGNLAVVWNTDKLTLQDSQTIFLPTLTRPALSQALRKRPTTIHRAALSCRFAIQDKTIQVTTVHLAWEGGLVQRLKQVRYLQRALALDPTLAHIICGDFNTIPPRWWQLWQQRKNGKGAGRRIS
jgi:endonuclease/exonuclease/phosphatase family metal-dependent hydrolase